jgi:7,8-dihydropterin-6-yl-methyl-4-(beta-D-ribofuranosyl)aminobenzene 5'-phosphate synthase
MKITCLVENTSNKEGIGCEHGFSLYIEAAGRKILFDTGSTDLFARNAQALGIDLSAVEAAVVSHGHSDHGGGIRTFLEINAGAPVYISRFAFDLGYAGGSRYIGIDPSLAVEKRLVFTGDRERISDGLELYSCNDRERKYPPVDHDVTVLRDGAFRVDEFRHEQYLLINEGGKSVLITGCSHKGIIELTDWFRPDVVVGGFHFFKLPVDDKLRGYAQLLESFGTTFYTGHCTGAPQFEYMKQYMTRLHYLSSGESVEL